MNVLVSRVRAITEAIVERGQVINATMPAQNQEIQDKLTEVLSAANLQLPAHAGIELPVATGKGKRTGITIWECRKRITELSEFIQLINRYAEHSSVPDRHSRSRESRPSAEIGNQARTELNLRNSRVSKYLKDADCYPMINWHAPPAAGGRTIQFYPMENLYSLHIYELSYTVVIDTAQKAVGYYQDQLTPSLVRTLNPFWWLARLVGAIISVPFVILEWAGFQRDTAENSTPGRLYKTAVGIGAFVIAVVAVANNAVGVLSGLGLISNIKKLLRIP
jgi:hypothetical protein